MHDPCFRIADLSKRLGGAREIKYGTLDLPKGRTTAIIGPSGCGKTTLLNLLSLMDKFDGGEITYFPPEGKEINYKTIQNGASLRIFRNDRRAEVRRRHFGMVFQFPSLLNNISIEENVTFCQRMEGASYNKAALVASLSTAGVTQDPCGSPIFLSGGELSRLSTLRALHHEPDVVFADEPTANLDERRREWVMNSLQTWRKANETRSLILVSHDMEQVLRYADCLLVLSEDNKIPRFHALPDEAEAFLSEDIIPRAKAPFYKDIIGSRFR